MSNGKCPMRILNRDEIIRLTGKQTRPAQARSLRRMGVDFRTRPDGEIIVIDEDLPLKQVSGPEDFSINAG